MSEKEYAAANALAVDWFLSMRSGRRNAKAAKQRSRP